MVDHRHIVIYTIKNHCHLIILYFKIFRIILIVKKIFITQPFEVGSKDAKPKSTDLHNSIIKPEDMLSYFIDENDICKTCVHDHSCYNRKFETDPCNYQDVLPSYFESISVLI